MTNFERDIEKIREISEQGYDLAIEDGELKPCGDVSDCVNCEFFDGGQSCSAKALMWLLEDDGKPSMERIKGNVEAWELARKIIACECDGGYSGDMIKDAFGTVNYSEVFCKNTYAQAAEKVRAWEEGKVINVGDVVEHKQAEYIGVVISCTGAVCDILTKTGDAYSFPIKNCTKTGRSLPVQDWLRQIGGEE